MNSIQQLPFTHFQDSPTLNITSLETELGRMIIIADHEAVYLLEFIDRRGLNDEIKRLQHRTKLNITPGMTKPMQSVITELHNYFKGNLEQFKTPIKLIGSSFAQTVWQELRNIPFGQTRSYSEIAQAIGKPKAVRAVAHAIATNQLAIMIPCHRMIYAHGNIGNYSGGISRKAWLIGHERGA